MFPASQLSRPRVSSSQYLNPQFQQQRRSLETQPETAPRSTAKNQIEAMPPTKTSSTPMLTGQQATLPVYNPALVHPVFFTDAWRKPPFPMPVNVGFNPVAAGYVFGNTRRMSDVKTKL